MREEEGERDGGSVGERMCERALIYSISKQELCLKKFKTEKYCGYNYNKLCTCFNLMTLSGTANFCRDAVTPTAAEEGLSGQLVSQSEGSIGCPGNVAEFKSEELFSLDSEGRAVITQHEIE